MEDSSVNTLTTAAEHYREHGYTVLDGYLTAEDLAAAQEELPLVFPTADEYHDSGDSDRYSRFAGRGSAGIDFFPFASLAWSFIGVSRPIVELAETLLGTSEIRLYELHNWAKYTGAAAYEQELHRDYGNHTVLVPSSDSTLGAVEMFIYLHDVPENYGPTHVVSQTLTGDLSPALMQLTKDEHPGIYAKEVSAAGSAGTVLAYRTDTFHRGTSMTAPRGARFALKLSYRTAGDGGDVWTDRLGANVKFGIGDAWNRFVEKASPRQLQMVGFPPAGHRYWTKATWAAMCERYPAADLSPFAP
jgi:ectoine hydroxylase-related dioxygenase (phytanoyl-CoA dioxygenase family)